MFTFFVVLNLDTDRKILFKGLDLDIFTRITGKHFTRVQINVVG
jgi:hypothetical protein